MKKYLFMLLSGIMLLSPLSTKANDEININSCNDNCTVQEITEDYVDSDWISVANDNVNQSIQLYATTKNLFITNYYQDDYNDVMQTCGLTIKNAGCTLTSLTMVVNYLNGTSLTPAQVNKKLKNFACPLNFNEAAKALGITLKMAKGSGLTTSYLNSELVTQLNNNIPVIIGMTYPNGGTHYVVVKGYSLSGSTYTFNINDPLKVGGKTTLNAYLANGTKVNQLIVYSD